MWQHLQMYLKSGNLAYVILAIFGLALITFLPTCIAAARRHPSLRLVAIANAFSIVSWVAWIAVLMWAVSGKRSDAIEKLLRKWSK